MADSVTIEGEEYVSSRRAAELSGYAQDYVGQLARRGVIEARRIGGLWYVSWPSLEEHKASAETYEPVPPARHAAEEDSDEPLVFEGKEYISSSRASDITGYNPDYVGQLARSGTVPARQVGNRWFIERTGILAHKAEKDALLAKVQSESVGISRSKSVSSASESGTASPQLLAYTEEKGDPFPRVTKESGSGPESEEPELSEPEVEVVAIPIRRVQTPRVLHHEPVVNVVKRPRHWNRKALFLNVLALTLALAVIVVSGAFAYLWATSTLAGGAVRAARQPDNGVSGENAVLVRLAEAARGAEKALGDIFESLIVNEVRFERAAGE